MRLVLAARLTVALTRDALSENHIQTAVAKGVPYSRVVSRHAAPSAYASIASLLSVTIPAVVTNMVLVEWVFAVPGFFRHTKRALGQAQPVTIDVPTLQALALWAAHPAEVSAGLTRSSSRSRSDRRSAGAWRAGR